MSVCARVHFRGGGCLCVFIYSFEGGGTNFLMKKCLSQYPLVVFTCILWSGVIYLVLRFSSALLFVAFSCCFLFFHFFPSSPIHIFLFLSLQPSHFFTFTIFPFSLCSSRSSFVFFCPFSSFSSIFPPLPSSFPSSYPEHFPPSLPHAHHKPDTHRHAHAPPTAMPTPVTTTPTSPPTTLGDKQNGRIAGSGEAVNHLPRIQGPKQTHFVFLIGRGVRGEHSRGRGWKGR